MIGRSILLIACILIIPLNIEAKTISLEEALKQTESTNPNAVESGKMSGFKSTMDYYQNLGIDRHVISQIMEKEMRARADYEAFVFDNRKKAFAWQDTSSKLIFWLVVIIVLAGLWMSYIQLKEGLKNKTVNQAEGEGEETHQIEISKESMKISSTFVGVVILAMSLVFFYLYLFVVYPITVEGLSR